jgi:O-acetyl-ADP-ribose deacetylase (regulator of RNase III)
MYGIPSPVSLAEYADAIHLFEPFDVPLFSYPDDGARYGEVNALLAEIQRETRHSPGASASPDNAEVIYCFIRSFLNVRPPREIPEPMLTLLDHYLLDFQSAHPITPVSAISVISDDYPGIALRHASKISLWLGDITRLQVDAIVNACNEQMLGCFTPMHKCIDNCIHTFASPRLRNDMATIMDLQNCAEPTGIAKVTRAYLLPSKFVLHTVGPVFRQQPENDSIRLLASSYRSCLDLAVTVGIRSVAFCCLSTGIFGFPNELASRIAVRTCCDWLDVNSEKMDRIIFNCFLEKDADFYRKVFSAPE